MDELTRENLKNKINERKVIEVGHRMEYLCIKFYGLGLVNVLSNQSKEVITEFMRNNGYQSKTSLGCYAYIDHSEYLFSGSGDDDEEIDGNCVGGHIIVYNNWKDFINNCDADYQEQLEIDCADYDKNEPEFLDGFYYITDKGWELLTANLFNILGA